MQQETSHAIETDALIIGAGPAGLFQAFQLGLLEIKAHIVEALPHAGGQCAELYGSKPIYDIPSVPVCTGQELTDNLLRQVAPFSPTFHFGQLVNGLQRLDDSRLEVHTTGTGQTTRFITRTVMIAAGVGAFLPRSLNLEGLQAFEGQQLFHSVQDPHSFENQRVVICGDTDTALEWALRLSTAKTHPYDHAARSVTLIHRRDQFSAAPELVSQFRTAVAAGHIQFIAGQATGIFAHHGHLTGLQLLLQDESSRALQLDQLLVLQGLSPKLGPITQWGLDMERKQLRVNTETYSTSEPGVFAVGDVNTYPGKKKLILCAFHECVLAAYGAASIIDPEKKPMLEYTTTSKRLHKLLNGSAN
jgi:thioredoxin reductase (NADPH)